MDFDLRMRLEEKEEVRVAGESSNSSNICLYICNLFCKFLIILSDMVKRKSKKKKIYERVRQKHGN
jgi:hypothetical protein